MLNYLESICNSYERFYIKSNDCLIHQPNESNLNQRCIFEYQKNLVLIVISFIKLDIFIKTIK